MMEDPVKIAALVTALIAANLAFFPTVLVLIAMLTGWRRLAETYRSDWPVSGTVYRFQSGQMRWGTNYGNCLTITLADEGLEVRVAWLFRPGHPPLLFPWEEITVARERNWLGIERVTLRLAREPDLPLRLAGSIGSEIERRLAGATP